MRLLIGLIVGTAVLMGCQEQHMQDIDTQTRWGELSVELDEEQLTIQAFDQIDVFQNLNEYPNMIRVCMDGVAFLMVSANWYQGDFLRPPYERVVEWDEYCSTR